MRVNPSEYLGYYESQGESLRTRQGGFGDHTSVNTTFSLALVRLEGIDPTAADLMRLCASLAPDAIPEELLTRGASELGERLGSAVKDPVLLATTIGAACRFSLMERDATARTMTIHRLVRDALRDELDRDGLLSLDTRAVNLVYNSFPSAEVANWPLCDRLLPHAAIRN